MIYYIKRLNCIQSWTHALHYIAIHRVERLCLNMVYFKERVRLPDKTGSSVQWIWSRLILCCYRPFLFNNVSIIPIFLSSYNFIYRKWDIIWIYNFLMFLSEEQVLVIICFSSYKLNGLSDYKNSLYLKQ